MGIKKKYLPLEFGKVYEKNWRIKKEKEITF